MDYLSPYLESLSQGTAIVQHLRAAAESKQAREKQEMFQQQHLALSEKLANANLLHQQHSSDMQDKQYERTGKQQDFNDRITMMNNTDPIAPQQPPPAGIAEAMSQQQFAGDSGRVLSDSPIPSSQDQSRIVTAPDGSRGYVPTHEEKKKRSLQESVDQAAAKLYHFDVPDSMADASGFARGSKLTLSHPPTLTEQVYANTPTPDPTEKVPTFHGETNDRGDVTPVKYNTETGDWEPGKALKGIGKTKVHGEGGAGGLTPNARGVQGRFDQREIDKAEKDQGIFQEKEQQQHALRGAYGTALRAQDGQDVIDPKTRKTVSMNGALRQLFQGEYTKATATAEQFSKQQTNLRKRFGFGEFENGGGQQPAAPGQPAAKPQGPKVAGLDKVRSYAKAKGISEAAAIKEFQASNFKVQ